ncbi:MAG: carbamoyltransferase HypF [Gemmatimonadales bacterium]
MSAAPGPSSGRCRIRARVEGVVQGVGFRPYVYRLAGDLGLGGFVRNDAAGVVLEVEGEAPAVDKFLARLRADAPPLACVERVLPEEIATADEREFAILESAPDAAPDALVAPDVATCGACLAELADPSDRRFRYPFINCTDCGPRFTIVRGVPYDRPRTTMAGFQMCAHCQAEYDDPRDRRFHAQPNACPECGPSVRLWDRMAHEVTPPRGEDAMQAAAAALLGGAIVAIKGIGGFHLACRADREDTVAALRQRKHREDRPFALMAADLDAARALADVTDGDAEALEARERPIVLCRRRDDAPVAPSVAPRSRELGLMLPYSPLHHLLLADVGVTLVMTSGNVSDEPIAFRDEDAVERLDGIADLYLVHDRPIETRTDDSVVRVVTGAGGARLRMIRRSRGYVPGSLELPVESPPLLACGAQLKHTFCLARGRRAWVSHHIGDLQNAETHRSFGEGTAHWERLFAVRPEVVAHDLHPDYLSTAYALARPDVRLVGVQHHHAHLAACLAEHGETGPALGAIFDGSGYGLDGTVWGGEFLLGDIAGFERVGHLWPVRLPGGDRAVAEPWRMACAWLAEATGALPELPPSLVGVVDQRRWEAVAGLARTGFSAPVTTSVGRLFDAVAALSGICPTVSYEGQAAIELEALVGAYEPFGYPLAVIEQPNDAGAMLHLDPRQTILAVAKDVASGVPPYAVSARFHAGLSEATALACERLATRGGTDIVVLSGGVFQNQTLLRHTTRRLEHAGLRVLTPERLPPNDGGVAYGQAVVAAASAGGAGRPFA